MLWLMKQLFPRTPFFSTDIAGIQGHPKRHIYMTATVSLFSDLNRPLQLLEIGSWVGSSALTWAEAISAFCVHGGQMICVDPWSPYFSVQDTSSHLQVYRAMDQLSQHDISYSLFLHNISFASRSVSISSFRGKSANVLPYFANDSFDVIYVDGSHYYDEVYSDISHAKRLVREGGIICGDDLELELANVDQTQIALHQDRDFIYDPRTGKNYHPGVTLAVGQLFQEVSNYEGYWLVKKIANGFSKVDLNGKRYFIPSHLKPKGN